MASITGTVSSVALNTSPLTANQKKMLEPAVPGTVARAAEAQNKPLSVGVGRVADTFTCRPPGLSTNATQPRQLHAIDAALQGGGRNLGSIFGLNKDGQQQAAQIHKLADGISRGTITQAETGHLLGQQVAIAHARGDSDTKAEKSDVSAQLERAGKELDKHGKPGTQLDKIRIVGAHVARG
ncbi:hypothetical protein [Hyalangium gracile]|uniref:hypothetical protein n=1 Tax=Hyalangium gracile TaxID=394092 RepID=UPI001CCBFE31|nr:hypothetical protein [Hyalangium gracile]